MLLKEWLEEISLINFGKEFRSLTAANLKLVWPRLIHTFGISRSISRSCLPIFLKITFGSHLEFKAFFLFNTGYLTEHAFHGRPRRYQPTKVELLSFKNKKKNCRTRKHCLFLLYKPCVCRQVTAWFSYSCYHDKNGKTPTWRVDDFIVKFLTNIISGKPTERVEQIVYLMTEAKKRYDRLCGNSAGDYFSLCKLDYL